MMEFSCLMHLFIDLNWPLFPIDGKKYLNDHLLVSNLRQRITLWFSFLPNSLPEGYFIKKMDLELDSIFNPKESH